ncbi:hypothetical protein NEOKW01_1494 [Nematocida sp. AWRm80]|nr:hypothetical protein NEOKW01_1494 [Nematocida sp. AWRm80]
MTQILTDNSKNKELFSFQNLLLLLGTGLCILGSLDPSSHSVLGASISFTFRKMWFITHFSLVLSIATLIVSLVERVLRSRGIEVKWLSKMHSVMVSVMCTAEILILLLFWPLFLINPALVFTKANLVGPHAIGLFMNMCMHLFPAVFLMIDFIDTKEAPANTTWYMVGYVAMITLLSLGYFLIHNQWRYKALALFPWYFKLIIPVILVVLGVMVLSVITEIKNQVINHQKQKELTAYSLIVILGTSIVITARKALETVTPAHLMTLEN